MSGGRPLVDDRRRKEMHMHMRMLRVCMCPCVFAFVSLVCVSLIRLFKMSRALAIYRKCTLHHHTLASSVLRASRTACPLSPSACVCVMFVDWHALCCLQASVSAAAASACTLPVHVYNNLQKDERWNEERANCYGGRIHDELRQQRSSCFIMHTRGESAIIANRTHTHTPPLQHTSLSQTHIVLYSQVSGRKSADARLHARHCIHTGFHTKQGFAHTHTRALITDPKVNHVRDATKTDIFWKEKMGRNCASLSHPGYLYISASFPIRVPTERTQGTP